MKISKWIVAASVVLTVGVALAQNEPATPRPPTGAGTITDVIPPAAVPRIVCDEAVYNFGEKSNVEDVIHTFQIRNDGNATLEIKQARPACGCTVANISNKTVPPGETIQIETRLSLRGRVGQQHKTITVESNDPKTPALVLTLSGNALAATPPPQPTPVAEKAKLQEEAQKIAVATDFIVMPRELSIEEGAQSVTRDLLVRTTADKPFEIKGTELPQPTMQIVPSPLRPSGFRIQLSGINGTPDLQGKVVKIQTTLPDHPEVVIPFKLIPKPR